jgi:hypothetical protein
MAPRTPISEQRRLVARWRASGRSITSFAESMSIPASTFWRWTQKHLEDHADTDAAADFVELVALELASEASETEPVSIGLDLPGAPGVRLRFEGLPDARWFGAVLREVVAC